MRRLLSVLLTLCLIVSNLCISFAEGNIKETIVADDSCEVVYGNGNNRNTIYVNNNATRPIYALYKLNIDNIPRAGRIVSAKLKITVNGVRSGTVSNTVAKKSEQLDWGVRENGYSYQGTEGFVGSTLVPNLGAQIGESVTISSAGRFEFDITEYVKEKKEAGESYLVVGLENTGDAEALFYSPSTSSGSGDTKPCFVFEYTPAEDISDIKELILPKNTVVNPPFDKNITDYNIAVPNDTEEVPVIGYIPEGSFCIERENVQASQFGDTAVITLVSESGNAKTYKFRVVKYSDLGISPDGEINYESPVVSNENGNALIKLSANSLSTVNKTVYIISSVTENGVLNNISATPWEVITGKNEKELLITLPQENPNVSVFVMEDFSNFIPLTESVFLTAADNTSDKYDEFSLYFKDLSENIISFSGKYEEDGLINFIILDNNVSSDEITENNLSVQAMSSVICDNEGYFTFNAGFDAEGDYTVIGINEEGEKVFEKNFFFFGYNNRKTLAESLYSSDNLSRDMVLSSESNVVKSFLLLKSDYENIDVSGYFYTILKSIFSANEETDKLKTFLVDYKKALKADMLNSGEITDILMYSELFELSDKAKELYLSLSDDMKKQVSLNGMKNKNFAKISDIDKALISEILLLNINEPESYAALISLIESEYESLGISLGTYNLFSSANKIRLSQLISSMTYENLENFAYDFNIKVNIILNEQTSGGGSSGGGSGGGGGSVSTPVEINKEIVNTPEVPAEELSEMKVSDFTDLEGYDWAKKDIFAFYTKGIISGKSEKNFAPGDNITRGEIIKIISGVFDLYDENAKSDFKDLENHWAEKYVSSVFGKGYILGKSENVFGVDDYITREDAAVIIYRIIQTTAKATTITKIENSFSDIKEISEYAVRSVEMLSEYGLLKGYEDGSFKPKKTLTRAEAVVLLSNVLKYLNVE